MASSKNIHLTFMSINFYVHNQQTLLKVNSLSIKIPIEMMKSNLMFENVKRYKIKVNITKILNLKHYVNLNQSVGRLYA